MLVNISSRVFSRNSGMIAALVTALFLVTTGCSEPSSEEKTMRSGPAVHEAAIPHSLVAEHKELQALLKNAIDSGGKTGDAARLVEERLAPHFSKEEEYALPPLTLLPDLAQGKNPTGDREMIERSEKMKAELPQMLNEHKSIVLALDQLIQAARNENKPAAIEFAEKLRLHAQTEEEILYPAAIVVGEYSKLRGQADTTKP